MTGFSADWLALREAADRRSRNSELAQRLSAYFALRDRVSVADLGSGTGSNLRATSALLPSNQTWTLIDYDKDLLCRAREVLTGWAEDASLEGGCLTLKKGGKRIMVSFKAADLAGDLADALPDGTELVTASAFFDLASTRMMQRLAKVVGERNAVFYSVLTYDGRQSWTPRHPLDNALRAAFHAHQIRDKGMGPAAGPAAVSELADALAMAGFSIGEGPSDWVLGEADRDLVTALASGYASAVKETGKVSESDIERWLTVRRTGAVVGHGDILAFPNSSSEDEDEDEIDDGARGQPST